MKTERVIGLAGVAETLLIPLCYRAVEARQPHPLLSDPRAQEMINQLGIDPAHLKWRPSQQTFAMLRALQDSGLAGKVKFVGFDSSEMLVTAMKKGQINGLVLQDPIHMGYLGVKIMVAHLQGQPVQKRIDTGSQVATPENMNDPFIKGLLEPDYKKWLKEE